MTPALEAYFQKDFLVGEMMRFVSLELNPFDQAHSEDEKPQDYL